MGLFGFLQEGMWFDYDSKGNPLGAVCKLDGNTVMFGYPDSTIDAVAATYHSRDKESAMFKAGYHAARLIMGKIIERNALPSLLPLSSVSASRAFEVTSYYELAFLTEGDLLKWTGCSSKSLRLGKPSTLQLEDGSGGTISGWHLSMAGMPLDLLMSCRKVRISSNLTVIQSDELMRPDLQCRPEQAADTLKLALRTNHEGRATQERCSGRQHVKEFAALLDKADELKKAFRVWLWCCVWVIGCMSSVEFVWIFWFFDNSKIMNHDVDNDYGHHAMVLISDTARGSPQS